CCPRPLTAFVMICFAKIKDRYLEILVQRVGSNRPIERSEMWLSVHRCNGSVPRRVSPYDHDLSFLGVHPPEGIEVDAVVEDRYVREDAPQCSDRVQGSHAVTFGLLFLFFGRRCFMA